jgi:hypothetical protein
LPLSRHTSAVEPHINCRVLAVAPVQTHRHQPASRRLRVPHFRWRLSCSRARGWAAGPPSMQLVPAILRVSVVCRRASPWAASVVVAAAAAFPTACLNSKAARHSALWLCTQNHRTQQSLLDLQVFFERMPT